MLKAAYGIASVSPKELATILTSLGKGYGSVEALSGFAKHGETFDECPPVIFTSVSVFVKTYTRIKRDYVAFVIDLPHVLETVQPRSNFQLLDFERETRWHYRMLHLDASCVSKCLEAATVSAAVEFTAPRIKPIRLILKSFERSSLLTPVQTFFYQIKDVESRKAVVDVTKSWMLGDEPTSRALAVAQKKAPKNAKRFEELLASPEVKRLRSLVSEAKKNPKRIDAIASQAKVSSFDLRYFLAQANKPVA